MPTNKSKQIGIGEIKKAKKKISETPRNFPYTKNLPITNEDETVNLIARKYEENEDDNYNYENEDEGQLSIDVIQNEEKIIIISAVAGVKKEDLQITLNEETLTIKGLRQFPIKNKNNYHTVTEECFWGNFSRSIILPKSIDKADIKANYKNNILVIFIPKIDPITTKIIRIG